MKVSIIVPVYNAEKYLQKCLNSLVFQTFTDFEIILINDGSIDESGVICDNFKSNYSNIVVIHKENGGSASARNLGLSLAKGEYIAFVDADDYVKNNFLERLVQLATSYNADLVECSFEIEKNNGETKYVVSEQVSDVQRMDNIEMLKAFCSKKGYFKSVVLWNKLIKKDVLDGLSFIEGRGIDDEYLIHKILYRSKVSIVTNEVLYFYYLSDGSQMRTGYSLKTLDSVDAIERQLKFFKKINNRQLYNMLLYRYYSAILLNYYFIKKYYKNENGVLQELKRKRKCLYKALIVKETPFKDKVFLLIKRFTPSLAYFMKTRKGK